MVTTSVTPTSPTKAAPARSGTSVLARNGLAVLIAFIAGHGVLAIAMKTYPVIATAHAVLCGLAGIAYAATTPRVRNLAVVVAYYAGCEVLWRMCKATIFWEFGKLATIAVLFVGLLRIPSRRNRILALLYFAFLVPSIAFTFFAFDPEQARQEVSFNLAGPFALTISVIFFSNIRASKDVMLAAMLALVGPVFGIALLAFRSSGALESIEFVNAASIVTSGGYGPNQVSALLGLAVLFILLIVIERKLPWKWRAPLFMLAAGLSAQAALTFARGGLVLAMCGLVAALLFLLRSRRARAMILVFGTASALLGVYVIEPRLDEMTRGKLGERFSSTKTSGRDVFVNSELRLFAENPVLGVGPGVGMKMRAERGEFGGASHTEYSRMLAEHGMLGVFSLLCLIALGIRAIRTAPSTSERALASAMIVWAAMFFLVYGTRVAAPSIVFGMAFARAALPRGSRAS